MGVGGILKSKFIYDVNRIYTLNVYAFIFNPSILMKIH